MKICWCFDVNTVKERGFDLDKAFLEIADAFLNEPHLLVVTPEDLRTSFLAGLSVIGFTTDGKVVCHTRLMHLTSNWFELGSTYVCPDYRGRHINHEMYRVFLPKHTQRDILATTTNPVSRQVGQDLGFVELQRRLLPTEVWRASCTCPVKKIGTANPECCALAFGESTRETGLCYFRVTQETAARHNLG